MINGSTGGSSITVRVCTRCSDESVRIEEFNFLSVCLTSDNPADCIADVFRTKLRQAEAPCIECGQQLPLRETTSLTSLPSLFVIVLQRYAYAAGQQQKIHKSIQHAVAIDVPFGDGLTEFKLKAVANHRGQTVDSGHYTGNFLLSNFPALSITDKIYTFPFQANCLRLGQMYSFDCMQNPPTLSKLNLSTGYVNLFEMNLIFNHGM